MSGKRGARSEEPVLRPEVFEEAAGIIAGKHFAYCCIALENAEGVFHRDHQQLFWELFYADSDAAMHGLVAWWRFAQVDETWEFLLECRMFALLLAAEWVRDLNRAKRRKMKAKRARRAGGAA